VGSTKHGFDRVARADSLSPAIQILTALRDLHRNHLGLIERAERSPSIEIAHRLAVALGITLSGLVAEVEREIGGGGLAERRRKGR